MNTCQGRALVASPYLSDPHFMRSVVYILRHDEQGAFGLVLNRPLNLSVGALLEELTDYNLENSDPVFYGGPVDGLVMMMQVVMGDPDHNNAVLVASDRDRISEIFHQKGFLSCQFRLFDGYSGWGPQQLDDELSEGSWMIWDILPDQLFTSPDQLWQLAVREIGRDIIAMGIAGSELPQDPSNN